MRRRRIFYIRFVTIVLLSLTVLVRVALTADAENAGKFIIVNDLGGAG